MGITIETKRKERADLLLSIIRTNLIATSRSFINAGRALSEFKGEKFFKLFGYDSFRSWFLDTLDSKVMCYSKCVYLMRIADGLDYLGVNQERVEAIGTTRLRPIFSCNPKTHETKILDLLAKADKMTIPEIQKEMGKKVTTRNRKAAKTIDLATEHQIQIVNAAIEAAKEGKPLTDGEALEKICKYYLTMRESALNIKAKFLPIR